MLKALLFDFGGVLAEEGFREGLKAIGTKNGRFESCWRAGSMEEPGLRYRRGR